MARPTAIGASSNTANICALAGAGDLHAIRCSFFVGRTRMVGTTLTKKGLNQINLSIAGVQRRYEKGNTTRTEYQNHRLISKRMK